MHVEKVTEPDRTLNITLDKEDILWLLSYGNIMAGRSKNIPREEGFDVQFISIRLEDFKKVYAHETNDNAE